MKEVLRCVKIASIYFLVVFAVACGSKKKLVEVESKKSDTLIVKTEVVKAPVINDVFTLKEICEDSVVTEFEKIFVRDTDTVIVTLRDNSLSLKVSQAERVIQEKDSIVRIQEEQLKELRETVKTRPDWKLVLILIGVIVLLWLFPAIPSKINALFRRLVLRLP